MLTPKVSIDELSSKTYQSALISSLNEPGHYAIDGNDGRKQEGKKIKGSRNDLYKRALIRSRKSESGMDIKEITDRFLANRIASGGLLFEAKKSKKPKKQVSASSNSKGVLHELLTGFHLKDGTHMSRHKDVDGDTPKQAHDKIKATLHPKEYAKIYKRAASAAAHIKKELGHHGPILDVHWASKKGDIERSTGIKSSQTEDKSDLMLHTQKKGKKIRHHGVSLKVSDGSSPHIPLANGGLETTYGQKIFAAHRRALRRRIPELAKLKVNPRTGAPNETERRALLKAKPETRKLVRAQNTKTLRAVSRNLHKTLTAMSHKELVKHIRSHVLGAHPTPLQKRGHNNMTHVTTTHRGESRHHSYDASKRWEHILRNPSKITMTQSGTGVTFHHDGKTFATQRIKFNSQNDPYSSIKTSGNTAGSSEKAHKVKKVAGEVTKKRKRNRKYKGKAK